MQPAVERVPEPVLEPVFRALADVNRRALLDALFAVDGQRLTELCALVPSITRFGVMKHLAVLEAAGLVTTERVGREKRHYLNPVPIQEIHDRWIAKYARPFTRALADLKFDLEHESHPNRQQPQPHHQQETA